MPSTDHPLFIPLAIASLVAAVFLWLSLRLRRRHRLHRDLPTSKVQGVFIGLVELKGTAESEAPLTSFLAATSCIHYSWDVSERWSRTVTEHYTTSKGERRTRTKKESGWTTVAQGGDLQSFYLQDDTGAIRVQPRGAKIEPRIFFSKTVKRSNPLYYEKGPAGSVAHSDHVRSFTERGISLHAPLYIVGPARERDDVVAAEITADKQADLFMISTASEERIISQLGLYSWLWFILGFLAPLVGIFVAGEQDNDTLVQWFCAVGGIYLFIWATCWTWMVFNSLVQLRNRVRQGWSLIDVQLKRRSDLIPTLTATVSSLSTHEQTVQEALAQIRAQATAPASALSGVSGSLRVVLENYPQLKAQDGFSALHRELVETEQRIALAREYYNEIATHFATRLECIPERWVAKLGQMTPSPLFNATHFERASVEVNLAQ